MNKATINILDGKALAAKRQEVVCQDVKAFESHHGRPPQVAVFWLGDDEASEIYIKHKLNALEETGFEGILYHLEGDTSEQRLLGMIDDANRHEEIDGILVQLPLPSHISLHHVQQYIHPLKDVDGFHPHNVGCLLQGIETVLPCTPTGILDLLDAYEISLAGKNITIVGESNIVGRPLAIAMLNRKATVTITHVDTKNLDEHIQSADIIVSAMGKPGVIQTAWLPEDSVVIDVGITRTSSKVIGDIDFESAKNKVRWITPVPGGVGPMTVVSLLQNTLSLADKLSIAKQQLAR